MSETVIKVEGVGKQYQLGQVSTGSLSHDINRWWHSIRGKDDPYLRIGDVNDRSIVGTSDYVWALRDVSFEVKKGEVLGIIGRNGAGKSTLLKILSRTTLPTVGSIKAKGRIASLLEVGTGFHPELTGRENIFLNGAILGMTKREILRKFDEIVDFSGVEKYIDTPVKRYSSGMYVRLAFAVAAHLEPEVLIVDEVLAVGDSEFQKKCLGKMNDVSKKDGRTVLFVSHNMGSIGQLCDKSILMSQGSLVSYDKTSLIIDQYLNNSQRIHRIEKRTSSFQNFFRLFYMTDESKKERVNYRYDESIFVRVCLELNEFTNTIELAMRLIDRNQKAIFTIHEKLNKYDRINNVVDLLVKVPAVFLTPGSYSWVTCINHPGTALFDLQEDVVPFSVVDTGSEFSMYEGLDYGCVFPNYSIKNLNETSS
jgi:lipopolysaccharide transport system ATP-binding protein